MRHFLDQRPQQQEEAPQLPGSALTDHPTTSTQNNRRVIAFLCPKVALVQQQSTVIQTQIPNRVVLSYSGNKAGLTAERWQNELASADIIVLTPQVLANLLNHGIVSLGMIELLVFDEAHHCDKSHPYAQIMAHYHSAPGWSLSFSTVHFFVIYVIAYK